MLYMIFINMNLKRIIKEEIDGLEWIKGVDAYYKVDQLEVGKTYQFVPDYSIMDKDSTWPQPHIEEAPDWISSYESQKFHIIKQEPNHRFPKLGMITFKQFGKSNKIIYDGRYTNISYTSRIFLWGKFKEVENPTMVTESSDFDWAEGPITFTVDDIIGKQMYYRENNVDELEFGYDKSKPISVSDIQRDEIVLGKIIWDKSYKLESHNGNDGVIVINNPKDIPTKLTKRRFVNFSVDDIVTYVNLGIWSMEDDNGNIINDFSGRYIKESEEEFDWVKNIEPELTDDTFSLYYNKPFYWYQKGEPITDWGMPRIYWFEESGIHQRGGDKIALLCYKDVNDRTTSEPKDECTDIFHKTAISFIKKGTLQHQPRLGDIKDD